MQSTNRMAASPASSRLIAIGRVALPWLIGPIALAARGPSLELVPPSPCPGLLELVSIAAVRNHPDLTAGALFHAWHATAIVVGLAWFVKLMSRSHRGMVVAAATGLAIGLSPVFASTLAPPWEAAGFAACAAAALLGAPLLNRSAGGAYALAGMLGVLLIAALIAPPWILVAAVAAGFIFSATSSPHRRFTRWLLGSAAATGLVCVALAVLSLSPPNALSGGSTWRALASCAVPLPRAGRAMALAGTIGWLLGPFTLALCLLGIFVEASRAGWRRSLAVAGLGLACLVPAAGATIQLPIALAPWMLALWWLAASGLQEIVTSISRGPVLRAAAVLLVLLLPILQIARVDAEERDDRLHPNGHEQATLRQVTAALNSVAPDAVFVEEDSSIDVLLRAATFGGRRTGKRFTVGSRSPAAVEQALRLGPVYAFPSAQEDLSLRGFASVPVAVTVRASHDASTSIAGIAAITGRSPCHPVGDTWSDLAGGFNSGRIALAADAESAYGPLLLFLGGSTAGEPKPDRWPPRTTRGFRFAVFDQRAGNRSDDLMAEARQFGLPGDHPVLAAPFVMRVTLHRTARAPLTLAVVLGAPFPVAVVKLQSGSAVAGHLVLCDAPAVDIRPFGAHID